MHSIQLILNVIYPTQIAYRKLLRTSLILNSRSLFLSVSFTLFGTFCFFLALAALQHFIVSVRWMRLRCFLSWFFVFHNRNSMTTIHLRFVWSYTNESYKQTNKPKKKTRKNFQTALFSLLFVYVFFSFIFDLSFISLNVYVLSYFSIKKKSSTSNQNRMFYSEMHKCVRKIHWTQTFSCMYYSIKTKKKDGIKQERRKRKPTKRKSLWNISI